MKNTALFNEANSATYCPEDDKLRLYVGRVPREEYDALRKEGWQATPKQDCDFSATWTVARKNTAESYAGVILDEDASPADRAADRADRFAGYLDKRLSEATGNADRFDAGPSAHGNQSYARAVRSADRHDRQATRAVDAWDKADYWQRRTAGVISSALYKASPAVRMGRIKTIEAEKRAMEKSRAESASRYERIQTIAADPDAAVAYIAKRHHGGDLVAGTVSVIDTIAGYGKTRDPRNPGSEEKYIFELLREENPPTVKDFADSYIARHAAPGTPEWENTGTAQFIRHCELRLAYEMQMLEAQGGRAGMLEMEVGGFIGGYQIRKINKSPATGRVVSVAVMGKVRQYDRETRQESMVAGLVAINVERLAESAYTAPTEADKKALADTVKAEKATRPASTAPPLVNPTLEEAHRLQDTLNAIAKADPWTERNGYKPAPVLKMTQAQYSAMSAGSYSNCETTEFCAEGKRPSVSYRAKDEGRGPVVVKVRAMKAAGLGLARQVIHLTDKPTKALPAALWTPYVAPVAPDAAKA